ncbi:MAG: hypothetical protein HQL03_01825 [Nitrospirae bacterium]|nr:hypothetical protein [Nitrospirota bacterium]
MQMLLESRVDRLETLMAEAIELHKELALDVRAIKLEAAERDRRYEERDRKDSEAQEAFRKEMREIAARFEERDRRFEERDRRFEERDQRFEERDRRFEERELKAEKAQQERDIKDKEEHKELVRERNRLNSDIAKKFGTLVEDIFAPGAEALIKQYFNCEPDDFRPRTKKRKGAQNCEVDLLLICEEKAFMIEVKSKPDTRDVDYILDKINTLPTFFEECKDKQIIPMLASTAIEDNLLAYANRKGLYVVSFRQWEYLDILNFDAINEKAKAPHSVKMDL